VQAYRSMVERRGVRWRCRQWVVIGVVVVPVGRAEEDVCICWVRVWEIHVCGCITTYKTLAS